ncbi:nucleoid-associated protein [Acidocella aminolytica]|uniref:Phage protein n=1 Tax=Acidocella aminolytica 101 = DSM 11237 TaxID=1120923 RepID=A0A0D6PK46_9PROT|nr:nucleoid-associated protein [Acidocella aminolytica]GAN82155.1 phage protein [Acidocella aminolytica 101 = DSM 11237]GBQ44974.1 phage protein [Acidocella aminolytica 101 = DSM 11237]SHF53113.1 nucleoid-associated protein [Acidocella aminolytica 101 = DSM 11237]
MSNLIINVAIHDLERGEDGFRVKSGNDHLAVTPTTQRVVDELYELYSRRASKSHGKFSTADDAAPTENHLRDYLDQRTNFADLTDKLMGTLKHQAGLRNAAQGGHVFFAHFSRDSRQFLLVAILNDKLSAALTTSYDVADVQHLDMDGFRFAGRINLTGWAANEERYIGFLKGKGAVSEYFMAFLGCDNTVQVRQDTTDLVQALKDYADDQGLVGEARDEFLGRAKAICDRASRSHEEIEFESLANELAPREPQALLSVLTDPERKLNDQFVPDRRALNSLVKFKGKTAQWSVEFERDALSGGKVRYDVHENTLTLLDLPDDLAAQLRKELMRDA